MEGQVIEFLFGNVGSPQNRCGVGVRCEMNVIVSELFFVGFRSSPNCGEIWRARFEVAQVSLASPEMVEMIAFASPVLHL